MAPTAFAVVVGTFAPAPVAGACFAGTFAVAFVAVRALGFAGARGAGRFAGSFVATVLADPKAVGFVITRPLRVVRGGVPWERVSTITDVARGCGGGR